MFTRKHFKAIAKIIKESDTLVIKSAGRIGPRGNLEEKLADYFKQNNPRFDRDKFIAACSLE